MSEPNPLSLPTPPRHDWRGLTLIGALCLASAGVVILAGSLFVGVAGLFGVFPAVGIALPVLVVAGLGFFLAWGVRHFDHWAYQASSVVLSLAVLAGARMVYALYDPRDLGQSALGAATFAGLVLVNGVWLHYLWTRRGDFEPWDAVTLSTWRRRIAVGPRRPQPAAATPPHPEDVP